MSSECTKVVDAESRVQVLPVMLISRVKWLKITRRSTRYPAFHCDFDKSENSTPAHET